jgi:hypothetical protein
MKLEEEVKKGSIFYIHSIDYNSRCEVLTINFLGNPEDQQTIKRVLIFSDVQSMLEKIDAECFDEDCLDSLISLEEILREEKTKYLIVTEQREISFFSKIKPQIQDFETP